MIAGKTLAVVMKKAIELFEWNPKTVKTDSRTSKKEILRLLAEYGLSQLSSFKKFSSWENIKRLNLVAVRYNPKTGNWHWVIAKRDRTTLKIHDPEKRITNRISRKRKARW